MRAPATSSMRLTHAPGPRRGKGPWGGRTPMTLTHHRLVAEWDIVRNDRAPDEVSAGSQYRAWWTCGDCGHSWRAHVVRRARGQRCPACAGKVATERTCLLAQRPDLIDEWDWCRNPRTPRDVTPGSSYRARWRCRSCGHAWTQSVNKRKPRRRLPGVCGPGRDRTELVRGAASRTARGMGSSE